MRINYLKAMIKTAVLAAAVLLLGAGVAVAQQQVNLTAGADHRDPARRLSGADVGLQLRRGRDRLDRNLRRVESGGGSRAGRRW